MAGEAEHPDAAIFTSFPGVGPVLTAVLLAEIGEDRARFPNAAVLLAEAGLAPVTRASGRSRTVRFRYAANSRLREATMWWAFNSMKESPWAAAAFRQARDQRGQHYRRALRGLGARWMRILWRCWTDVVPYNPSRHGAAALTSASRRTTTQRPSGTRQTAIPLRPLNEDQQNPGLTVGVCRVRFMRNALAKVSKGHAAMVALAIRTVFTQPTGPGVRAHVEIVARTLDTQSRPSPHCCATRARTSPRSPTSPKPTGARSGRRIPWSD